MGINPGDCAPPPLVRACQRTLRGPIATHPPTHPSAICHPTPIDPPAPPICSSIRGTDLRHIRSGQVLPWGGRRCRGDNQDRAVGETISGRLPQPFRGGGLSQVPAEEDAAARAEERAGRGRRRLWLPLSGMPGPGHCSRGTGAASTEHEVTCSPSFQGVTQRCVGRGRGCPPGSRSVAFVCPPLPDQSPAPGTGCQGPGEQSNHATADQRGAGLGSRPIKAALTAPLPLP